MIIFLPVKIFRQRFSRQLPRSCRLLRDRQKSRISVVRAAADYATGQTLDLKRFGNLEKKMTQAIISREQMQTIFCMRKTQIIKQFAELSLYFFVESN